MTGTIESTQNESAAELQAEAALFARYLTGVSTSSVVVERYVDACRKLLLDRPMNEDRRLLVFVRRHPSSLPPLDAACALVRPDALLRKRLFVMLALLETTPSHASLFLARPKSLPAAAGRLALYGLTAAMKIVAGLVLYPLARSSR